MVLSIPQQVNLVQAVFHVTSDTHSAALRKMRRFSSLLKTLKETELHIWQLLQEILKCLR